MQSNLILRRQINIRIKKVSVTLPSVELPRRPSSARASGLASAVRSTSPREAGSEERENKKENSSLAFRFDGCECECTPGGLNRGKFQTLSGHAHLASRVSNFAPTGGGSILARTPINNPAKLAAALSRLHRKSRCLGEKGTRQDTACGPAAAPCSPSRRRKLWLLGSLKFHEKTPLAF